MTNKDMKRSIKDYWIQVAAGITVLVIGGLCAIIPKVLSFFINLLSIIWQFFVSPISMPLGMLFILVILSLITLSIPIKKIIKTKHRVYQNDPSIDLYIEDTFFGSIWRWLNIVDKFPSNDLWCFCPRDNTRLVYETSTNYFSGALKNKTTFSCETCGYVSEPFDGDNEHALSVVARQIERRINTGEWKDIVERKRKEIERTNREIINSRT